MKYLLIGMLLLALLIGFCLWSGDQLRSCFAQVSRPLDQACSLAEAGALGQARQSAARAAAVWEASYPRLAAFLDHNDIDGLTREFAALADVEDAAFCAACRSLQVMLRKLSDADTPVWYNLL